MTTRPNQSLQRTLARPGPARSNAHSGRRRLVLSFGKMRHAVLFLLSLSFVGCSVKYDYVAETKIEGFILRIGLKHSHPFLAEYKRVLEVERDGRVEKKEIFPDTGGNAWVAVVDDRGRLELRDLGGIQFSDKLPSSARKHREYLGRFDFDAKKSYRFIPASSDPREPQPPR